MAAVKFKILDQIQQGRAHDATGISGRVESAVPPLPADLPAVRCDRVSTMYWEAEVESFAMESNDFGIIRPPFPLMFFEWETPSHVFADGAWRDAGAQARQLGFSLTQGAIVHDLPPVDGKGGRFEAYGFILSLNGRAFVLPVGSLIGYDEHGLFLGDDHPDGAVQMVHAGSTGRAMEADPEVRDALLNQAGCIHQVAAMAISFMHCKGAGVEWVTNAPAVSRKAEAAGYKGPRSYGIVKVPDLAARGRATRRDVKDSLGERMSAHWVRGHFKTYTPDAPLFGSRTGSFWWQPSVRGKRGEAHHRQYDVQPVNR